MGLGFLKQAANVVLVGPNGVGKSTIAANIAHRAVLEGHTVRFTTAASMLGELAAIDSDTLLQRKLRFYARQPPAGDRRSRIPLLLQPPRRPAVPHRLQPQPAAPHHHHHQPPLLRVGRGLPQRRMPRRPRRPPRPQRRDHPHRRRLMAPQGGRGTPESAHRRTPAQTRHKQGNAEPQRQHPDAPPPHPPGKRPRPHDRPPQGHRRRARRGQPPVPCHHRRLPAGRRHRRGPPRRTDLHRHRHLRRHVAAQRGRR